MVHKRKGESVVESKIRIKEYNKAYYKKKTFVDGRINTYIEKMKKCHRIRYHQRANDGLCLLCKMPLTQETSPFSNSKHGKYLERLQEIVNNKKRVKVCFKCRLHKKKIKEAREERKALEKLNKENGDK